VKFEENEEFENKLFPPNNQVDEMSGSVSKLVDFSRSQETFKMEMEDKMENLMNQKLE
jgi:hypothetical protein